MESVVSGGMEWSSDDELLSDVDDDLDQVFDLKNSESRMEGLEEENLQKKMEEIEKTIENTAKDKRKVHASVIRALVSKQKKRFEIDGFNLDLTSHMFIAIDVDITPRLIAMGFPSIKLEKLYRNSLEDVQKFLRLRHTGHYRVYNLCAEKERQYPFANFENNVGVFPFYDHNAPPFDLIFNFCIDVQEWFKQHPSNVAAVHCKAGKGRTGLMICCYLLYSRQFTKSYDALRYYGMMRTKNKKGVTIPSQLRYIYCFETALNKNWTRDQVPRPEYLITKIRMVTVPQLNFMGGSEPWFMIHYNGVTYNSNDHFKSEKYKKELFIDWVLPQPVSTRADVKIEFFNKSLTNSKERMFHIWFHTGFIDDTGSVIIDKTMIDRACQDKHHKKFPKDLGVEIHGYFNEEKILPLQSPS